MRVLWLAKGLGPGGMERLLETHARIGDRDGHGYFAAYLVDRPNSVIPALEALDVSCTRLGSGRGLDPRWAIQLRGFVREHRIDVVHVHSPMVAAVARVVLRTMRHRPAIVYTEHNSWDCYSMATRLANAVTYPLDDAQVAVSAAAASSSAGRSRRGVEVLTHGIDLEAVAARRSHRAATRAELGLDGGSIAIVTVANLRAEKGYDVLLEAAAQALSERSNLVFLSLGQGPLIDELRARHDGLGLGGRFRFLGFRDDVHDVLAASDVFCLASRHEGLPVALMEAYAMGLPVVATRVGGLPDVVESGGSGLLVAPDDPAALAAAILAIAADREMRLAMGRRSLELAERFDAAAPVRRIESIYAEVCR